MTKKALTWMASKGQAAREIDKAKMDAAHAWYLLDSHEHRYQNLLRLARRLFDGAPLEAGELEEIERTIRLAPLTLIDQKAKTDSDEWLRRWFAERQAG